MYDGGLEENEATNNFLHWSRFAVIPSLKDLSVAFFSSTISSRNSFQNLGMRFCRSALWCLRAGDLSVEAALPWCTGPGFKLFKTIEFDAK